MEFMGTNDCGFHYSAGIEDAMTVEHQNSQHNSQK